MYCFCSTDLASLLSQSPVFICQEGTIREQRKAEKENLQNDAAETLNSGIKDGESPFAAISATMGWETFHMVHTIWLGIIDLPPNSKEKDWELQVKSRAVMGCCGTINNGFCIVLLSYLFAASTPKRIRFDHLK